MNAWVQIWKGLSKSLKLFVILLVLYVGFTFLLPGSIAGTMLGFLVFVVGGILAVRYLRVGFRKAIWGLRNRLLVAYVFIAVVPVSLIAVLVGLIAYSLVSQLAVYLALSDLQRRTMMLHDVAETIASTQGRMRPDVMGKFAEVHRRRFPELTMQVQEGRQIQRWPDDSQVDPVPAGWGEADGVIRRNHRFYLWSHVKRDGVEVTAAIPLTRSYLSNMVPNLGDVALFDISDSQTNTSVSDATGTTYLQRAREPATRRLPAAYNQFDIDVRWLSTISVGRWDEPGKQDVTLLIVHTRPSAVMTTVFDVRASQFSEFIPLALLLVSALFLLVELVSLVIGVSLTRSITTAVAGLYEGTQRVMKGDFSHRIQVKGRDQLATLGTSFNSMTENLERLLAVAKEKERLQAELEIAKQVQEQLYPKTAPKMRTLQVIGLCEPARMVSGDYYDYFCFADKQAAIAIGDVAGKGISAALLMATIQSAMRMELRNARVLAAPGGQPSVCPLSTAVIVSELNKQLHATTTPEKYATFFLALYDEDTGCLQYTNAGHLPPVLVRNGEAHKLEVSGTVVGAFPSVKYQEDRVVMQTGDLLVCYTDGITEPENEYGEEFGEERLIDIVTKNADRDDGQIISMVMKAVHEWTHAEEQPDDMTLVLARRI